MDENLYSPSFPSFFPSLLFPLSMLFIFLSPQSLVCYWMSLTFFCWLSLCSLISSHLPSSLMISCSYLSVLHDLPPHLSLPHLVLSVYLLWYRYCGDTLDKVQRVIMETAEWWGEANCRWKSPAFSSHYCILFCPQSLPFASCSPLTLTEHTQHACTLTQTKKSM